jgi:hypothetical protein
MGVLAGGGRIGVFYHRGGVIARGFALFWGYFPRILRGLPPWLASPCSLQVAVFVSRTSAALRIPALRLRGGR